MFIGELMKLAEQSLAEGLHPRLIAEARADVARFVSTIESRPKIVFEPHAVDFRRGLFAPFVEGGEDVTDQVCGTQ